MKITLHSRTLSVLDRYSAGHVLTEGEAKVLNEYMAKRLRERLRKSWRRYKYEKNEGLQLKLDHWVEDFVCVDGERTVERAGKAIGDARR